MNDSLRGFLFDLIDEDDPDYDTLDGHYPVDMSNYGDFHSPDRCVECDEVFPCQVVRELGAKYADRPGYRAEWAPSAV